MPLAQRTARQAMHTELRVVHRDMARRKKVGADDAEDNIVRRSICGQSACDHARSRTAIAKCAQGDGAGRDICSVRTERNAPSIASCDAQQRKASFCGQQHYTRQCAQIWQYEASALSLHYTHVLLSGIAAKQASDDAALILLMVTSNAFTI